MKRRLLTFTLAVLTVGLLGSCSKINERIDGLDKRVYDLENNKIASVEQQITAINTSINELKAADVTINGKIADLKTAADAQQALIDALQEADRALGQKDAALEARIATLEGQVTTINGQIDALVNADIAINTRIDQLQSYVDTEIGKAKDWATATFASLTEYEKTAEDLAALSVTVTGISTTLAEVQTSISGLDAKIDGIDSALQDKITTAKTELEGEISDLKAELEGEIAEAIATSEAGLKSWVNEQLSAYYTAAQMDAKIDGLQNQLDDLKTDTDANKSKIEELETKLAQLEEALEEAKTTIKAAYEKAIKDAIEDYNGTITETIQTKIDAVNETITALTGRVEALETTVGILTGRIDAAEASIATIEQQIAAINQSISDLETIRTNIQELMEAKEAMGEDISELQAKDQALEGKITDLKNYVDTELANYATTDWANATFATLAEQEEIITEVAKLKQDLEGLDTKLDQVVADIKANLDQAIADLETSLKDWVNEQLTGYYTTAQIDEKIDGLQNQIDDLKADTDANKSKIEELETELDQLTQALEEAKTTIKTEYEAAIATAIEEYNGTITQTIQTKIDEVNATIANLTGRVDELALAVSTLQADVAALKAMIQSVSITPAYSDGSVEADENGILTIKCIVSPAEALDGIESLKDSLLIYADYVKVKTKSSPAYTEITVSEATVLDAAQGAITLKADISEYLPKGTDKALTVALKIKNGISNYTTEFVPVYVAGPALPAGALTGKFSVSATKQVYFSKGNLYYDGSKFNFEANQYGFNSSYQSTYVSHFFWSKDESIACAESYDDPEADNSDVLFTNENETTAKASFTVNVNGKEQSGWRTLSTAEWQYLFDTRTVNGGTKEGKSYQRATINSDATSVYGMILYPDNYTSQTDATSYTSTEWTTMEENGCVFLPAAGLRSGSEVLSVGDLGVYWSSTANDEDGARSVGFLSDEVYPDGRDGRSGGFSVRLITDASAAPAPTPTTTGTAKRTGDIDVNWVQLWANGPKFAEYNVGASSATDIGSTMTFTDATKAGAEYVWGANWCTPSKDQMDELLKAATDAGSEKVECEYTQEGSQYGFKFTGLTVGYTDNSVFFPANGESNFQGRESYWSASADEDAKAWLMFLSHGAGGWTSKWNSFPQFLEYFVRPVLKN